MKTERIRSIGHERSEAMGRDSVWTLLLRFSGPAVIAAVVSASYNLVDAIFVGYLGTEALAALSISNPLMTIYWSIGVGIGVGATSLIARRLGSGVKEEANRTAGNSITLFFMASAAATAVFVMNLETLLRLFGADDSVLPLAKSYMFVETIFIPLNFILILLAELVRVQGNPNVASAGMITSGLMNCIFDPILMWGFGPFPAFGIAGAAIATSVGRSIGACILLLFLASGKSAYRLKLSHFLLDLKIVSEIYRVGISVTVRTNAMSLSQIIAARAASSFGVIPLAVLGVLFRTASFAFMPCVGVSQGILPLIGYNFGAQMKDRVGEVVIKASFFGLMWGALCWAIAMTIPTQIMSLFGTEPDFLSEATPAFSIYALSFFVVGLQIILGAFFQGIGKGLLSLLVASSRQLIFLIPCLLIMPSAFGLIGVWAAHPVADALSLVFTLILVRIAFHGLDIPFRLRYDQTAGATRNRGNA